ncbi:hypothetical protein [Paraburkholderia nodosa]|uniref:hypothetical protein n=1 Tax=Paraburkholderia nodosa TaxID=392320 RepID=UPI00114D2D9F|nr:hypothetical protein [Paraburkholderia nodosa]
MNEISDELAAQIKRGVAELAACEKAREREEQAARIAREQNRKLAEHAERERYAEIVAATVAHFRAQR